MIAYSILLNILSSQDKHTFIDIMTFYIIICITFNCRSRYTILGKYCSIFPISISV